ncbi:MAG TPA: hypothetical protein VMB21_19390 [Candidatus Limnocylindria bacterium]|nr:hypothetical protein [Candidatus Limnocylindria bacterium]
MTEEQTAIATVLAAAISSYSEDVYCAGWLDDIEHQLWETIAARKPDAYECAVQKLHAAAKKPRPSFGKPSAEFLSGLKLLAERFQVWVVYQEVETAIHLQDWLSLHEEWHESKKQQRPSLEEVWQQIHQPFPFSKSNEPAVIPPMPKLE